MNTLFKTVTKSHDKESVIPFQHYQNLEHIILIEDLELNMMIGISDAEKQNKQRVIVNLEISLDPKEDYDEKIDNTVCYAELIKDIEELSAVKHYHLVETLAEEITSECFKRALVNEVTISVKKPDIIESTKSVGFKMSVKKSA